MNKIIIYIVWWDNRQPYEDHQHGPVAFYTTREEAQKHIDAIPPIDEDDFFSRDIYEIVERELLDKFIPRLTDEG